MAPLGFPPEERPFRPHLTLARIKQARRDDWPSVASSAEALSLPAYTVDEILLYKSDLTPTGPHYTHLARVTAS
jgi:2'-5' RNA ligase